MQNLKLSTFYIYILLYSLIIVENNRNHQSRFKSIVQWILNSFMSIWTCLVYSYTLCFSFDGEEEYRNRPEYINFTVCSSYRLIKSLFHLKTAILFTYCDVRLYGIGTCYFTDAPYEILALRHNILSYCILWRGGEYYKMSIGRAYSLLASG